MCIWSAWASLGYYQFECQCSSLKLDSGWFTPVACVIQDRGFLCGALSTIHRRTRTKSSEMFTSPKLLDISDFIPEMFSSIEMFSSLEIWDVYILKAKRHLQPWNLFIPIIWDIQIPRAKRCLQPWNISIPRIWDIYNVNLTSLKQKDVYNAETFLSLKFWLCLHP